MQLYVLTFMLKGKGERVNLIWLDQIVLEVSIRFHFFWTVGSGSTPPGSATLVAAPSSTRVWVMDIIEMLTESKKIVLKTVKTYR